MTGDTVGARAWRSMRSVLAESWDRLRDLTTASPSRFAVGVFLTLILLFTALFMLPAAAADGQSTAFADALFTAVSTICVTGLSTVDMGTHWSPFGHVLVYIGVNVGVVACVVGDGTGHEAEQACGQ